MADGSGLPITRTASANQNVTNDIPLEKTEERPSRFAPQSTALEQREELVDSDQKPSKQTMALVY